MSLADELRESRSKHMLKSYAAAVKQLRVFKAALPITSKKSESSGSTRVNENLSCKDHSKH